MMDKMQIKSKWLLSLASSMLEKMIKKKTGVDCRIQLNEIALVNEGETTKAKLDICAEAPTSVIQKLTKEIGL